MGFKLLGLLQITNEDGPASEIMKQRKGCALLAYLLVTGQPQRREFLADLLWEASTTSQSLQNLRKLLSRLRRWLPQLEVTRKEVSYSPETAAAVDYLILTEALDRGSTAEMDAALALYQGDLLDGFYLDDAPHFNEWLLIEREKLRVQVTAAYRQICFIHSEQEAWEQGIAAAQRWLAVDVFNEEVLRHLLQFLAASGQIELALQQYKTSRQRLWDELGAESSAETVQLVQRLQLLKDEKGSGLSWSAIVGAQLDRPQPGQLAQPGPLPANAIVPYGRNNDFTGRHQPLLQLADLLLPGDDGNAKQRAVAITGMGGLGKTQLAVEFCYRYGRFFPGGTFWLSFANEDSIAEAVATIGGERGLGLYRDADQLTQADKVDRVRRAWQAPTPRLLVFDNCGEEKLLQKWMPVSGGCRLLLTSRRHTWSRELAVSTLSLPLLTREESTALLHQLVPDASEPETAPLHQVAAELGDLPLALNLAGNFLRRYRRITPDMYLRQLRQTRLVQHPSLQGQGSTYSPTGHALHVGRTFAISLEQLDPMDEVDRVARQLLARAAYFAPGELIPRPLLLTVMRPDDERSTKDLLAELLAEDALARLLALGFLQAQGEQMVVMHRLVVLFTHEALGENSEARTAVACTVQQAIETSFRRTGTLFAMAVAPVHVRHLIHNAPPQADATTAALTHRLGLHYHFVADFDASHTYLQLALSLLRQVYGDEHTETAGCLNNLASLHLRAGNYREARALYEQALDIREKHLAPGHPDMANPLGNLGYLLTLQGDYQAARYYVERGLAVLEHTWGPEHARTATGLNNLGMVLLNLGDYEAAQAYLERALAIRQRELGVENPYTAVSQQNMGLLHLKLQEYNQANLHLETALAIREKAFGDNHPHTARSLNALGELYLAQDDDKTAQAYFEQTLCIQENVLSADHPEKALTYKNLGGLYWARQQWTQARSFYEAAQTIWAETVVPEHPGWSIVRSRLAQVA